MAIGVERIRRLFVKPGEPLYIPQDGSGLAVVVPPEYLPAKYTPIAEKLIASIIGKNRIQVKVHKNFKGLCKKLEYAMELDREEQFSLFIPEHVEMAGKIIDVLMGEPNFEDFFSMAVYCRENMNTNMFIYALSVAILHRPDTKNVRVPSLVEVFPHFFITKQAIKQCREEAIVVKEESRRAIVIPRNHTATDLDVEHRIAYFREDLGINLHHHYWHLVYPTSAGTDQRIVAKDRRGELFYYLHQQMLARYNFERFSNRLGRAESLIDWRVPIPEGYFSKLGMDTGTGGWPGRHSGATIKDVNLPSRKFTILDCERMGDRISEAIHRGFITDKDGIVHQLNNLKGIDILGNIVEASVLSLNPTLYGNLHSNGHVALASCHDPDYRHLEGLGVMGHPSTAMRDPIFYRWHTYIDNIFRQHKDLLPPYTKKELEFGGVQITDFEVIPDDGDRNAFYTFWRESDVDLRNGLNFQSSTGAVLVRFTHLDHKHFSYKIKVNNVSGAAKRGTVRIFMAPRFDERRMQFEFDQQRIMMTEMDKFTVDLPAGSKEIVRRSSESSVIIPFEQTFPNLDKSDLSNSIITTEELNYCGCGWPEHMLVPKGIAAGLQIDLFVMISDYEQDEVKLGKGKRGCKTAASFCGLKDEKYPDARSMGYPFDRVPVNGIKYLQDFLTGNMRSKRMEIIYSDHTEKINDKPGIALSGLRVINADR